MKKIIAICGIVCASGLSLTAQNFGTFKMLDKGVIDFGSHYFQTETPNTYQQSALRSPEVKKTQDSYEISGDYIISPESKYKFSEKIQKIKNGISYQASVTSDTKIKDDFAFVFYMPTKLYLGRVWIDDKQFDLKSGEKFLAKKIRVVRDFTVLEIRGEFECQGRPRQTRHSAQLGRLRQHKNIGKILEGIRHDVRLENRLA